MQGDSALGRALGLVRELRQRCPWDRAQTPQTLRPYLVEEALELDHAIQTDDPEAMRDELGDLLLHLAFQIVIGEERSQFNAEVVTHTLEEKMWRRHPNLFGEAGVSRDDHAGQELERANAKFTRRFEKMEQLAEERGLEMGRASLEELDKLWDEVKRNSSP